MNVLFCNKFTCKRSEHFDGDAKGNYKIQRRRGEKKGQGYHITYIMFSESNQILSTMFVPKMINEYRK